MNDNTLAPPKEYEGEKQNSPSKDIVVPPPVFADGANDVPVPTAEACTTHEQQSDASKEVEESRACLEKTESVVDGGDKVVETNSGDDTPETIVPAPTADITDHNENVVEPPAMNSGPTTEVRCKKVLPYDLVRVKRKTFKNKLSENLRGVNLFYCRSWLLRNPR